MNQKLRWCNTVPWELLGRIRFVSLTLDAHGCSRHSLIHTHITPASLHPHVFSVCLFVCFGLELSPNQGNHILTNNIWKPPHPHEATAWGWGWDTRYLNSLSQAHVLVTLALRLWLLLDLLTPMTSFLATSGLDTTNDLWVIKKWPAIWQNDTCAHTGIKIKLYWSNS